MEATIFAKNYSTHCENPSCNLCIYDVHPANPKLEISQEGPTLKQVGGKGRSVPLLAEETAKSINILITTMLSHRILWKIVTSVTYFPYRQPKVAS